MTTCIHEQIYHYFMWSTAKKNIVDDEAARDQQILDALERAFPELKVEGDKVDHDNTPFLVYASTHLYDKWKKGQELLEITEKHRQMAARSATQPSNLLKLTDSSNEQTWSRGSPGAPPMLNGDPVETQCKNGMHIGDESSSITEGKGHESLANSNSSSSDVSANDSSSSPTPTVEDSPRKRPRDDVSSPSEGGQDPGNAGIDNNEDEVSMLLLSLKRRREEPEPTEAEQSNPVPVTAEKVTLPDSTESNSQVYSERSRSPVVTDEPSEPLPPNALQPTMDELIAENTERGKAALRSWYARLRELTEFKRNHGHTNVPQQYDQNHALGIWVNKQRMERKSYDEGRKSSMTLRKIDILEKAGFRWAKRKGQNAWDAKFRELQEYKEKFGDCDVPTKYAANTALGRWVSTQRHMYKQYQARVKINLPRAEVTRRIQLLNDVEFSWNMLDNVSSHDASESV